MIRKSEKRVFGKNHAQTKSQSGTPIKPEFISRLAAGHAHVPRQSRALVAAVDDEVVAFGLARYGLFDGGVEELVAFGRAQRLPQVGGVFLAEAHVERARTGDAHAVAGLAEIMGQRRDEA